jgi:hypothetical protein
LVALLAGGALGTSAGRVVDFDSNPSIEDLAEGF